MYVQLNKYFHIIDSNIDQVYKNMHTYCALKILVRYFSLIKSVFCCVLLRFSRFNVKYIMQLLQNSISFIGFIGN